jgi:hypothetical protein
VIYCNQKLPAQATGTCLACPDCLILKAAVEREQGADFRDPIAVSRFKETRPGFSEWNHCGSLARQE